MNILLGLLGGKDTNGLDEITMDKALRKVPPKELAIATYKRLDKHMDQCASNSKLTLAILLFLALSKLSDLLHLPSGLVTKLLGGS